MLGEILDRKAGEVDALRRAPSEVLSRAASAPPVRPFAQALTRGDRVAVIAEHKRRAPSAGWLAPRSDAGRTAAAYEAAGAAAVSVLTDGPYFGGSLDDVGAARAACTLPILRKDFVLDPLQVVEARGAGADAILLIVRALSDAALADLHAAARDSGMDALVEVHDEEELDRALSMGASLIGINSRDLRTFETDLTRIARIARGAPSDVVLVGESGVTGPEDVRHLAEAGVHAVLVGTLLMRAPVPQDVLAGLAGVARAADSKEAVGGPR